MCVKHLLAAKIQDLDGLVGGTSALEWQRSWVRIPLSNMPVYIFTGLGESTEYMYTVQV